MNSNQNSAEQAFQSTPDRSAAEAGERRTIQAVFNNQNNRKPLFGVQQDGRY